MILLVGLGNPGPDYAKNRHNIGFMAVETIHRRHGFSPWRAKFSGEVSEGNIGAEKVVALKPMTYMNESGRSVAAAAQFYKIEPADIIVLHDELDLLPGKVKVKFGGGHAGHNGLRSLTAHIGPDFHRVRLGIGHPGAKELVHNWVLGNFAKVDGEWVIPLLEGISAAAPKLVAKDFIGFMNEVAIATRVAPEEKPAPKGAAPAPDKPAGPAPAAKNAMAETLRALLALKKPPGRRPGN
ncbi:MAG: aminoacyl-tRNA hydrolase [Ancalomicrobiaceae bacterium]|nr:aminoacyl-tRNA hydrolase [Ancalomicrobiaceae bacterium]